MAAVLVTYDMPGDNNDGKLLAWIKTHDHVEIGQSSYVIKTKALVSDVFAQVPAVPTDTKFLVLEVPELFFTTSNLGEAAAWIRKGRAEAAEPMGDPGSSN